MQMRLLFKALLWPLLICYLLVTSASAVHAFSFISSASEHTSVEMSQTTYAELSKKMDLNCHQMKNLEYENMDSKSASVSFCKILCASVSNVISNEITDNVVSTEPNQEITFLSMDLTGRDISVEPYPPK